MALRSDAAAAAAESLSSPRPPGAVVTGDVDR
jgi:hypothetical protein